MDPRPIRLFEPAALHAPLQEELEAAVLRVVRSGRWVLGEEVARFEEAVGAALGGVHAVGVSSGSDALWLALAALGVGPGDEVLVPAFTFFATVGAVLRRGATPRLVDVAPGTFHLDPARAREARSERTRAVIPVHLFGEPVDVVALGRALPGVPVVADAAQAFGAAREGVPVGKLAELSAFSFFPTKPLGALGDGGLVTAHDAALAERVRALRQHGAREPHVHEEVGANHRLDAVQAAALAVKLPHAERWRRRREELARVYEHDLARVQEVTRPCLREGSAWAVYAVRVPPERRDGLRRALAAEGIETGVYYPKALSEQRALWPLGYRAGDFPESERAAREVLGLPLHAALEPEDVERVAAAVVRAFARSQ